MFNDDFNNMNSNPENGYSERDRLEINQSGDKRGKQQSDKRQEQRDKYNQQMNGRGGRFNKFGRNRGNGGGRGGGSWLGVFLALCVVGGLIYLPIAYKNGTLPNPLRSLVGAKPQDNADKFLNDVQKFKKEGDKAYENRWSEDYEENTKKTFYDVNPLFNADYMGGQVEPEYVVMVYTGNDELDKPFIDWIEKYEKETPKKDRYKIYRISFELAQENMYVQEAVTDKDYNITEKPLFMIYNTPEKNKKVLDSIIAEKNHLDNVVQYMDDMVSRANANR